MAGANPIEAGAMINCGELLKFAAENKAGLPIQIIADIEAAWDAQSQSTWNNQVATRFWAAYDGLCSHLRPVTLDTLNTSQPVDSWFVSLGMRKKTTIARRWAHVFLTLLIIILAFSMYLAFITTVGEILIQRDIPKLMDRGDNAVKAIREQLSKKPNEIEATTKFDLQTLTPEARAWVANLMPRLLELFVVSDTLYEKSNAVSWILWTEYYRKCREDEEASESHCYNRDSITQPNEFKDILDNIPDYYDFFETQREVRTRIDLARIRLAAIKSYLLPALLGMLGACTYVVRSISEQIKDYTFSPTSPLRHSLRVALGSIVGVVVVTFYGIAGTAQLSASAWAFIAGYAIEPVFAAFDSIAAKFK